MTDETTLDLGELSKHKPTIAEFNEGANDQANYGQEGLYVMPYSLSFPPEGISHPNEKWWEADESVLFPYGKLSQERMIAEQKLMKGVSHPYEVIKKARMSGKQYAEKLMQEKWKALPDFIKPSQVVQHPSGAIIKLKNREHAIRFIEEKKAKYKVLDVACSRCIFWANGDITIDLFDPFYEKSSYKGFFHNNLK